MAFRLPHMKMTPAAQFLKNVHSLKSLTFQQFQSCQRNSSPVHNVICAYFSSLSRANERKITSISSSQTQIETRSRASQTLLLLLPTSRCSVDPCRQYGRKVKPKPQKITFFEYSGDLRTLPEFDESEICYPYLDHQEQLEGDETVKKLVSFEFASERERNNHLQHLVRERMIELFGPDSELEQRIARFTLHIRQKIPYCIENRTDKFSKIWLLKSIFHRRRLLNLLREIDHERFEWLLRELKIRYVIPQDQDAWKGWKYNLQESTKGEMQDLKREKLKEFKVKLEAEREAFAEHKANVLAEIHQDLERLGLSQDFLDEVQKKDVEKKRPHKILTWNERVKLGMTDKIKEYYG